MLRGNSCHGELWGDASGIMSRPYLDGYNEWLKARVKAAKKIRSRAGIRSSNERMVTDMSINKNTMEVTRLIRKGNPIWNHDSYEMCVELRHTCACLFRTAKAYGRVLLNEAFDWLALEFTREGLTTGWEFSTNMKPEDFFTWAFCADGTVEVTFHNLKDISNLYKTEEELA